MNSFRIQALAVIALAILLGSTGTEASDRHPVSTVTPVATRDEGACIAVTFYFSEERKGGLKSDESFIDFSVGKLPSGEATTFTAYLSESVPIDVVDLSTLPIVSYWEITPMDHDNGLGGYVRLYLPAEILPAQTTSNLCLIIQSDRAGLGELLAGAGRGRLVLAGVDREVAE